MAIKPLVAMVAKPTPAFFAKGIPGIPGNAGRVRRCRTSFGELLQLSNRPDCPIDVVRIRNQLCREMSIRAQSQCRAEEVVCPAVPGVSAAPLEACCRAALRDGGRLPVPAATAPSLEMLAARQRVDLLMAQGTFPPHALSQAGVACESSLWRSVAAATWRCLKAGTGPGSTYPWRAAREELERVEVEVAVQWIDQGDTYRNVVESLRLKDDVQESVLRRVLEGKATAALCDGVEWSVVCASLGLPDVNRRLLNVVAETVGTQLVRRGYLWRDVMAQLGLSDPPFLRSILHKAAARGPCLERVLQGEGWEQVSDAFELDAEGRTALQKALVDARLPLRLGQAWWDLAKELALDMHGEDHLSCIVAVTEGLERVKRGDGCRSVISALRLPGGVDGKLERLVVDTLAIPRLADGKALDGVIEALQLSRCAQGFLRQRCHVARVETLLADGITPAEKTNTMAEDDSGLLRRQLLNSLWLRHYAPRSRGQRPVARESAFT